MKKIKDKLTAVLNAVTFAEAGEHEAAIEYLDQGAQTETAGSHSRMEPGRALPTASEDLVRKVEDHMVAAAFAEAGEPDAALELLRRRRYPRSVLLVLDGHQAESDPFTYAVSLCKRISAGVEVLAFSDDTESESSPKGSPGRQNLSEHSKERLDVFCDMARRHGVSCELSVQPESTAENLFEYVLRRKEISAVIVGPLDKRKSAGHKFSLHGALERIAERLSIPLVTVLKKRQAT